MYGSRLLFRGYGSNQRLRVVDAAMAGTDSLVLLDEAHLAPHLRALLPAVAACTPDAHAALGEARSSPRIAALTATGDAVGRQRFDLDEEDQAHPVVRQRLDAVKPLELLVKTGASAKCLADATLDLLREARRVGEDDTRGRRCVVFTNTPKTARETFGRLRKLMPEAESEVLLLTGLMREREAERVRARILDRRHGMAAARVDAASRQRHLIVVATQTLEVGADIDAEYLVTEACGVRALTQRLGRLNRLGRYPHARAAYVHLPPPKPKRGGKTTEPDAWPVYGTEPTSVLERLQEARAGDGTVSLSPRRVAEVLGPPQDLTGRAPEVLPGILWEWTKTTTPPDGEAPVEPYFSGIAGPQYSVSLIWRIHVPEDGERLWPRATDREAVDVPIGEARDVLGDEELRRLASDGVTLETASSADLRPGDQIVLATDRGLLDAFGWNPAASGPVVDVSLVAHGLPLDARAIERLCGVAAAGLIQTALGIANDDEGIDPAARTEAAEEILRAVKAAAPPPGWGSLEWADFTGALSLQVVEARGEVPRLRVRTAAPEPLSGDFDETSLGADAVELERHGQAVAARARAVALQIGLPHALTDVVELAGRLHDVGKADRRFQRWLDPEGQRGVLVAKSQTPRHLWEAMRVAAAWPRGGRHEDLSARLVRAWLEHSLDWGEPPLRDLLLHLVISHHGKGRPLVPPVVDGTPEAVSAEVAGASVRAPADLGIVDWEQPARFRRLNERFGPMGAGPAGSNRDSLGPCGLRRGRRGTGRAAMTQVTCPGLPGAWINGWLAAVGATVLDARIRLHWTTDGAPLAVLSASEVDPVAALVESWPDATLLADLPIAKNWKGAGEVRRTVPVEAFAGRARAARGHPNAWTLSSTMTDLCVDEHGEVAHGPFDPSVPKGITLHQRLLTVHGAVKPSSMQIGDSLAGCAVRVEANGLGFDLARLGAQTDDSKNRVDPVVEVLAFFGLALLPVRGRGSDRRLDRFADVRERQRGWQQTPGRRGPRHFHWPAWGQPLDSNGIDALLDVWSHETRHSWMRVGVHAGWRVVPFQRRGAADATRAFGAERL